MSQLRICSFVFLLSLLPSTWARAENILVIGDSHSCQDFGTGLLSNLSREGHNVTLYCAPSSSPRNWVNRRTPDGHTCNTMTTAQPTLVKCAQEGAMPDLAQILRGQQRVIVALGTNSLGAPQVDRFYEALSAIVHRSGARCEWVGPPHLAPTRVRNDREQRRLASLQNHLHSFYDSMEAAVGRRCTLVDSRGATSEGTAGAPTRDGVHRTRPAGQSWAQAVTSQIFPQSGSQSAVQRVAH